MDVSKTQRGLYKRIHRNPISRETEKKPPTIRHTGLTAQKPNPPT